MEPILFYHHDKPFAEFSNYWDAPMEINGVVWPTIEHFYQALKTDDEADQERIRLLPTPGKAKRAGQKVTLRHDWEKVKENVMYHALRQKFIQHPRLCELLVGTGMRPIHEDSPSDTYWGCRVGKDRLGVLLMKLRTELRNIKIAEQVMGWSDFECNYGSWTGRLPGSQFNHFKVNEYGTDPEAIQKLEKKIAETGRAEAYVRKIEDLLEIQEGEKGLPLSIFKIMQASFEIRCVAALQAAGSDSSAVAS